ncbi:MAG: zinc-dependent peptidase [Fuerstiella sp.]
MIFGWFRKRRRQRILAAPFPDDWNQIIAGNVAHDAHLPDSQRTRLRQFVQIFVAEKNWEGCNGLKMTDEVRVTIAAQAALLVLNAADRFFDHVLSILVYPDEYVSRDVETDADGIVTEQHTPMLGQAVWRGPVLLSWADVLAGGQRRSHGGNLVLHEFAHQLDMMNGWNVDGIPPLDSAAELQRWVTVLKPEYELLVARCRRRHRGVIDCYGAQNEAEFFAVLVESFFEKADRLRDGHPHAYQLLCDYFGVNPAAWTAGR